MRHGEDNRRKCTDSPAGCHPIRSINAPTSIIPQFYSGCPSCRNPPGSEQAPNMLDCIPAWLTQSYIDAYIYNAHSGQTQGLNLSTVWLESLQRQFQLLHCSPATYRMHQRAAPITQMMPTSTTSIASTPGAYTALTTLSHRDLYSNAISGYSGRGET